MDIKWNQHVVILYDRYKDADIAKALTTHMEREFSSCDVIAIDSNAYDGEFLTKTKRFTFSLSNKAFRGLIRRISVRRDIFASKRIQVLMETNGYSSMRDMNKRYPQMKRFLNIIKRFEPVIVICTNPESLKLMLIARELLGRNFKVVGAISDFALDLSFVRTEADGYFVENPDVKAELEDKGIVSSRIAVIGYPTLGFDLNSNRTQKRMEFGLAGDLPFVVVYGGVYDTRTIKDDIVHLMKNHDDFILMIITADKRLKRYYMDLPEFGKNVMLGDSLTKDILDITDCLVTVPDTGAIFEGFLRGIPVIVEPAVTILEKRIRRYLLSRYLIVPARTPDETLFGIREILHEPDRANEFRARGLDYSKSSLRDIANIVPKISKDGILKLNDKQAMREKQNPDNKSDDDDV